jgi:hypothetical protein
LTPDRHLISAAAFGPWATNLSAQERACRWRSFASLAAVFTPQTNPLARLCLAAEDGNPVAAADAWRALETLGPITRRRLLATYNALAERRRKLTTPA